MKKISTSASKEFLGSPKFPNLAARNANNLLCRAIGFQAVVTETVPLTIATGLLVRVSEDGKGLILCLKVLEICCI